MLARKSTFYGKADQKKFKVILVGDSGVGKTTLFMAFTDDNEEYKSNPAVTAVDFRIQSLQIEGRIVKLHIWDTAGQQRFRSIVSSYFKGCQGAIIVFDLSRKQSYLHATNEWLEMCKTHLDSSEIMLIGNKSDLQRKVTDQQVQEWCSKNAITYFVTSIEKLENIHQPFLQLTKKMIIKNQLTQKNQPFLYPKQKTINPSGFQNQVKIKSTTEAKKKKKCC